MKKIIYLSIVPVLALMLWSFSFKYVTPVKVTVKADKLLLVEDAKIGKNPKVFIDGKKNPTSTLTKRRPKSVKSSNIAKDRVTLSAIPNRIEYERQQEIENVRIQRGAQDNDLFIRYTKKRNNGKPYEMIKITLASGSYGSADIPVGGKVLFIVDGKEYNEDEFKKLDAEKIRQYKKFSIGSGEELMRKEYPKYSARYDAFIKLNN